MFSNLLSVLGPASLLLPLFLCQAEHDIVSGQGNYLHLICAACRRQRTAASHETQTATSDPAAVIKERLARRIGGSKWRQIYLEK